MAQIPLGKGGYALVDDEDYERLSVRKWWRSHYGYAVSSTMRNRVKTTYWLHREVLGDPQGQDVDHINGDRLDCRKSNLRACSRSENLANMGMRSDNTSGYKGVYWSKQIKRWIARIGVRGKYIHIGTFDNPLDAAIAYNKVALEERGAFARLNVLPL